MWWSDRLGVMCKQEMNYYKKISKCKFSSFKILSSLDQSLVCAERNWILEMCSCRGSRTSLESIVLAFNYRRRFNTSTIDKSSCSSPVAVKKRRISRIVLAWEQPLKVCDVKLISGRFCRLSLHKSKLWLKTSSMKGITYCRRNLNKESK